MQVKKENSRALKVAIEIKKVLSEYLICGTINDYSKVRPSMISITEVVISADLSHAKVFICSIAKDVSDNDCLEFLNQHSHQLRHHIAQSVRLKFVPELRFFIDTSFEYANKIDKLFKSINKG
ncbi:MAG: 30S ribosome-binding factor RbfA [Alphaproteobacteria bacterium]|nr:30S ribosome-binding factor RbfA [Alphaproteobacteria bacterium]